MRRLIPFVLIAPLMLVGWQAQTQAATGTAIPFVKPQYFDANGDPLNGAQLFIYSAGTSTKITTYSDAGLTTQNTNPVVLDSAGRASIFVPAGTLMKLVMAPSTDTDPPAAPLWTVDGVSAIPPASTSADVDVSATAGETLAAGDVVALSDGSGGGTAGRWYKADADFTYLSTTAQAVGFANSAASAGSTLTIRRLGRVSGLTSLVAGTSYYVSATAGALTAVAPTNVRIAAIADSTTTVIVLPGHPIASATVPGIVGLLSQTLGSGATTDVKTVGGIAVNSTPNWKPGSDTSLDAWGCSVLRSLVDTTQHANSGTGETTLTTISLPAGALATNGAYATFEFGGTNAANGNTKTIKFKFGATVLTMQNGAVNGGNWNAIIRVIRTGTGSQKIIGLFTNRSGGVGDANPQLSTSATETMANAITVTTTGQSGTASSDVIQEAFLPGVCG